MTELQTMLANLVNLQTREEAKTNQALVACFEQLAQQIEQLRQLQQQQAELLTQYADSMTQYIESQQ